MSNDVLYCLMLSADIKRVFKKFLKGYLNVYGIILGVNAYKVV